MENSATKANLVQFWEPLEISVTFATMCFWAIVEQKLLTKCQLH